MHIEISHRHARHAMRSLGMARGNGCIGKKAKPHGPRRFGVMAGRASRAKGVADGASANRIHRRYRRAGAVQGSLDAAMGHDGISIQRHAITLDRSRLQNRLQIGCRMHAQDLFTSRARGLGAGQRAEGFGFQGAGYGAPTIRAFRVVRPGIMRHASGMGQDQYAHAGGSSRLRMTKR